MKNHGTKTFFLLLLAILLSASMVSADGVLEINQACVAKGCFAGDSAGFPVTLSTSGSYRLTSNLEVTAANSTALNVEASYVAIDLNGFALIGPIECSGDPVSCNGTGSGSGIRTGIGDQVAITVRNGSVSGFGTGAVQLDDFASVENVRAIGNVGSGIRVGRGSQILGSISCLNNFDDPFFAGIEALAGSRIVGNTACQNAGFGILASEAGNFIEDNSVWGNAKDGLSVGIRSSILDNVVYDNGGEGINMSDTGSAWGRNTVNDNSGTAASSGLEIEENLCDGSLTCP